MRILFYICSVICCLILFISIMFLPFYVKMIYFGWVLLSVGIVAFSARLFKSGMVEVFATLLVGCLLFTMFLILNMEGGDYGRGWMILRFAIPFMNLPSWWAIGSWIKERVDLSYFNKARQAADEINRILDARILNKKKIELVLEQYTEENREVLAMVSLIKGISEDDSGEIVAEIFANAEERRIKDLVRILNELTKSDKDYKDIDYTIPNLFAMLKRVTGDISRCEWKKPNPAQVTSADYTKLMNQLRHLKHQ